jgi:proline racemase
MADWVDRLRQWIPPDGWRHMVTVDVHAAGEPLRVVVAGFPQVHGATLLKQRRYAMDTLDHLRRALMWEPRGHADMYGCIVVPSVSPRGDIGVLFTHNGGFSTMCGHGIIGVTTALIQTGILEAHEPKTLLRIDTPAGFVEAWATVSRGLVHEVAFINVRSFVTAVDRDVEVPGVGRVRYDTAFGGAFYAYVAAEDFGLELVPGEKDELVRLGRAIKASVQEDNPPVHPREEDLGFIYGTIFVGAAHGEEADSRNVCVFADGEIDRSPTGTGVSGRLALAHKRGEMEVGDSMTVESILGTRFSGRILGTALVDELHAVVPEITGQAFVTARSDVVIDPRDPLGKGFLLR